MINKELEDRILVLDGALGTMIQSYKLTKEQFHGERFESWGIDLKGCNDILVFTNPTVIEEIHTKYLEAGADIITTNSFNANAVSMADYGLQDLVYEINYTAATLARNAIYRSGLKGRYVAGSVGPTGRSASMSPRVEDAAFRNITFEELLFAYQTQIEGLVDGGVDVIILETSFDTLNTKAAVAAHELVCVKRERFIPLMISGTITDKSGRTLSGQTVEAFCYSLEHSPYLLSIGLNCAFGAELIYDFLKRLERVSTSYVSVYPNAGLPDEFGGYNQSPEMMGVVIERMLAEGLLNIVGGCCGTTPEHIKVIAEIAKKYPPRKRRAKDNITTLTGLEPLRFTPSLGFINIGERANVAGSAKFARLIREKMYDEAVAIVESQIESGASVIDVCMDAPMIDAVEAMEHFLRLLASEPTIARLPIMVDSSKWEVLERGLQSIQGKSIVNSISLKEGEADFLRKASIVQKYGAAVVVMLFDERGQADSYDRKVEVATRAYNLLVGSGFAAEDIIFDPNVLTICTGLVEHDNYAVDFIKATKYIKDNLHGAKVSGGVSNLSFSFRGNNIVREAMHSIFLYHAIKAGMDMAIVNAATLLIYEDIDTKLLTAVEDAIFNRDSDATERLIEVATSIKSLGTEKVDAPEKPALAWREQEVDSRIAYWVVRGINDFVDVDINESLAKHGEAVRVIEQPLMDGMKQVGSLFNEGKMFLPQVVKSARVMKRAVDVLAPYISKSDTHSVGKVVVATVKGDVHDIGKNIVSIVLSCNGFEVIDLGVMTAAEDILDAVKEHNPSVLALSGLITPSLDEMAVVIEMLEREGVGIPVLVGGATTSQIHTAVKLAPLYSGVVAQAPDASSCTKLAIDITGSMREATAADIAAKQQKYRDEHARQNSNKKMLSLEEARSKRLTLDFSSLKTPNQIGQKSIEIDIEDIISFINWTPFFSTWEINGHVPKIFDDPIKGEEATKLYNDAIIMLDRLKDSVVAKASYGIYGVESQNEDITLIDGDRELVLNVGRNVDADSVNNLSLADFVAPSGDHAGVMVLSVFGADAVADSYGDDTYSVLLVKILCDRLVEAAAEYLHFKIRTDIWGYAKEEFNPSDAMKGRYVGIRPAFGYPSLPDHAIKGEVFKFMNIEDEIGTVLTENYAMSPASSVSAMIFSHKDAKYFAI